MSLRFLGTGGAFDYLHGNSAALLECGKERLLIDCGHAIYPQLCALDLANSLTGILITHTHDDHVGSLGSLLAHQQYKGGRDTPMPIYYPSTSFRDHLAAYLSYVLGDVDRYVDWRPLTDLPGVYTCETTGHHAGGVLSYAYAFVVEDTCLAYSGDLAHPRILFEWLQQQGLSGATVFHDIAFDPRNTHHTYYKLLEPYLNGYKVYGYHCDPTQKPKDCSVPLVAEHAQWLFSR